MSAHVIAALCCFGITAAGIGFMLTDSIRSARRQRRADVAYVRSVGQRNGWRS